jgi:hypothetical protein
LTAVARDAAGNLSLPASVTVTVANTAPPTLTFLVGDQAVEPKVDGNTGGSAEAFSATAVTTGAVTRLSLYVDASSTATSVAVGLYTDNGGHPGALLTQGTLFAPIVGAWNSVTVPAANVAAGATLWFAVLSPNGAGTVKFRNRCCGAGTPAEASASVTLGALPQSWAVGRSYRDGPLSAYGMG